MTKSILIITALAIFLLLGTTSLAIGAAPSQINSPVPKEASQNIPDMRPYTKIGGVFTDAVGTNEAYINAKYNGEPIGWLYLKPYSEIQDINMYTTLNSAYWENKSVYVYISNGDITGVQTEITK